MTQFAQNSIPRDKFLTICINLLHRNFIECNRTDAKRLYQEVRDGKTVTVTSVQMEDDSTVAFRLSLDHSEFDGHFNFSVFRAGLATLVGNISTALQEQREVKIFSVEKRRGAVLFGITGVTIEDGKPCVMALGADTEGEAGAVTMRLMYLDPSQFAPKDDASASSGAPGAG